MAVWHVLTGEYPPAIGGVADHACVVANGLADAGDEVHVWAPECGATRSTGQGRVYVHWLPGNFGARALNELSRHIADEDQILVEYVPHAFGFKSVNLGFCLWLRAHRNVAITVLFHEVAYALTLRHPMRYNALGIAHRVMAWIVGRSATRVFVTIPAWVRMLRPLLGREKSASIEVLTTHNLIPVVRDVSGVARLHDLYAPDGLLLGTFGTYGASLTPMLEYSVPHLLRAYPCTTALFLGRNGDCFKERLSRDHPDLRGRLFAPGVLTHEHLSRHLSACDILLQPYPDGATGRRSTLMGGLAHGRPIVTTTGALSEPYWAESDAVCTVPAANLAEFAALVGRLVADAGLREQLRSKAARFYAERFGLDHTITALRGSMSAAEAPASAVFDGRESLSV